ncbi:hypothetical protein BRC83_10195 [Halobacteriales archaeon QS_1_68_17]|nr:MAG: hypothetical protein BRC83_10195 [Halobacteriales archaeon QS_1_68_17]
MSETPTYDNCAVCGADLADEATTVGEIEVCGPECARAAWITKELYDLGERIDRLAATLEDG